MPINALIPLSTYNPQPESILDAANKAAAYRNALSQQAITQQEQQKNAIALDQMRRQVADEQATRKALAPGSRLYGIMNGGGSPAADPMGSFYAGGAPGTPSLSSYTQAHVAALPGVLNASATPIDTSNFYVGANGPASSAAAPATPAASAVPTRPRVPTIGEMIQYGVPASVAPTLLEKMQGVAKTAADIDKLYADADNTRATTQETRAKVVDTVAQQEAQMADTILHGTSADGSLNPALIGWSLQTFASHGPEYAAIAQRIGSQLGGMDDAGAKTFLGSLTRAPKQMEANAAETTAAARTADAQLARDKFGIEKPGMEADAKLKQLTAAGQAPIQPADAQRIALERRARDQEQQNINLRAKMYQQQFGNPLEGASDSDLTTARMRAAGTLPLPSPRSKGYDRAIALAASVDTSGNFSQYAGTRFDTVKAFREKGDGNDLVQLATALEHLHLATENSKSMEFEPTLSLNLTPAQRRYHQDVYNLTDEVGKLIKSGVVPEHEGKRAIDNLMSAFQANRDAGLDELSQLMGGKVAAKIQKYVNGTGQLLPATMFDKPTQERLKAAGFGNGIDWNAQATTAAAGAAPAAKAPDLSKVSTADLLKALGK